MARLPHISPDELNPEYRHILDRPIGLFRVLANSPDALTAHQGFGRWIRRECELDPRIRELAILAVGYVARAPYEFSHHLAISREFGVTDEDVAALIEHCEGREAALGELERAVADAARQLTAHRTINDDTWATLARQLPAARLTEVVMIISFYNSVVRILAGLQIEVEPEYAAELERFPLPSDTSHG